MKQHLAFFGFASDADRDGSAFAETLINAWPDEDERASVEIEHFESHERLSQGEWKVEPDACGIYVHDENMPEGLFGLLDYLFDHAIPVLVISEAFEIVRDRLYDDEVVVCSSNEPADRIALRLHALASRQSRVRQIRQELTAAIRCQGGLHGEIHRIEEELQLAAMIQREFLPKELPEVADVRFGVFYRPAGYVSGDIYNVMRLDEDHVGFFLADAVGHGVPAALMTMVIAHSLKLKEVSDSTYRILPPGEVLARLNESIITHHADNGRFATGVYGIVNVRTYEITVAAAGHPPPLWIDGSGESEHIDGAGGLLGVFPGEIYEERSFTLKPGDRFFLYTDGFEMAFPDRDGVEMTRETGRRLPTLRYIDEIRQACSQGRNVNQTIDSLENAVDSQPGSLHQVDDLTGLCVARLAESKVEDTGGSSSDASAVAA